MPTIVSGVQYSGKWNLPAVMQAEGAGNWPKRPSELWAWGDNAYGCLGLGDLTDRSSPVQVAGEIWSDISFGGGSGSTQPSTLALKTDGTIWSWGANRSGACGQGNTTAYSSPVQVGALTTWVTIGSGSETDLDNSEWSMAIKNDGTLWTWGEGSDGQLGVGNLTNYSSPVQVGALTTWSQITGGRKSTIAIKTDGIMWVWGDGGDGALGLGNTTSYSSPVQLGALTTWGAIGSSNFHTGTQGLITV